MANLLEVEYEKIFSPKTMAALKGKSGESLRQMLGNKDLMYQNMLNMVMYMYILFLIKHNQVYNYCMLLM